MGQVNGSSVENGNETKSKQDNNSSMEWDFNAIFAHMRGLEKFQGVSTLRELLKANTQTNSYPGASPLVEAKDGF